MDSSYSLGRLGWLTNKSTPLICGEDAVNETQMRTARHSIAAFYSRLRLVSGAVARGPARFGKYSNAPTGMPKYHLACRGHCAAAESDPGCVKTPLL